MTRSATRGIVRKDAAISNTGSDDAFPGSFDVILSSPTEDRDGETLNPEDWVQPLPGHITFDADHAMSVAGTVGSGTPALDKETGNLTVSGTYSSLPDAQRVRTLVNEGHIRTVSVAYLPVKSTTKGQTVEKRELLNGAFVAVPSNREALIVSSKSTKAGARNSSSDLGRIQSIHDAAAELGAECAPVKVARAGVRSKAVAGSLEEIQAQVSDAVNDAYGEDAWACLDATIPDGDAGGTCVFTIYSPEGSESDTYQQTYTIADGSVTLVGERAPVDLVQMIRPDLDDEGESSAAAPDAAAQRATADGTVTDKAVSEQLARIRNYAQTVNPDDS